jgi:hypothetical protein
MLRRRLHLEVTIRFSRPFLVPVVHLALVKGEWSCVSRGSPRIQLVFMFVGLVSDLTLSLYLGISSWAMVVALMGWSFVASRIIN